MIKKFRLYIMLAAVMLSATSCLDKLPEDEVPFDQAIQTVECKPGCYRYLRRLQEQIPVLR